MFIYVNQYSIQKLIFLDPLSSPTENLLPDDDWNAVQLLLAGFSGSLKFWWDNYLTEKERFQVSKILNDEGEQNAVIKFEQ